MSNSKCTSRKNRFNRVTLNTVESRILKAPADVLKSYTGLSYSTLFELFKQLKIALRNKQGRPFSCSTLLMLVLTLHRLKTNDPYRDFYLTLGIKKDTANRCFKFVTEWMANINLNTSNKEIPEHVAVDTTAILVRTTADGMFSPKHGKKVVKIQTIVDDSGNVRQVSNGYTGSSHVKTIFETEMALEAEFEQEFQVITHLVNAEVPILGDKAYQASEVVITPHRRSSKTFKEHPELCRAYNDYLNRKRVVVEHSYARIKQFRMLQGLFRDKVNSVAIVVKAVVAIVHLQKQVLESRVEYSNLSLSSP